jgi:deoxycytidylate deaminase
MNKWLRVACKVAVKNWAIDPSKTFALGAVLIRGGSVITMGTNKRKTAPVVQRLSKEIREEKPFRRCTHAELDCICRLTEEQTRGAVLYVARVTKDLATANAEPCPICKRELFVTGIRKVHYTAGINKEGVIYF